jgi:hypothetical protein
LGRELQADRVLTRIIISVAFKQGTASLEGVVGEYVKCWDGYIDSGICKTFRKVEKHMAP